MKNGYRITDAHAHVFPDKIAEKATEGISHFYDLPMQYHWQSGRNVREWHGCWYRSFSGLLSGNYRDTGTLD